MTNKRTRKDKKDAKHPFLVDWSETGSQADDNKRVKGKIIENKKPEENKTIKENITQKQDKLKFTGSTRHEIFRTILIAIFILGIELVLYLTL